MKSIQIKSYLVVAAVLSVAVFTGCKTETPSANTDAVYGDFQLIFASGSGSLSGTFVQGVNDVSTGDISFAGRGFEVPSSRTARVFASTDGATLYSLSYRVGTIHKLAYNGGQNYVLEKTVDASVPLGSKGVRFTKLSDQEASVHELVPTAVYADANNTQYLKHKMHLAVGLLDLGTMSFKPGYKKELEVKLAPELEEQGYYIGRVDAPVISNDKLYYGANLQKWNKTTGRGVAVNDFALTLVIDYPTLENPKLITSTLAKGTSNGYRTPTQHKNEAGEILQMVSNTNGELALLKIVNGEYHPTYKYDLNKLLGKKASSNGWFYAGGGIGYIPYQDFTTEKIQIGVNPQGEPSYSYRWKVARMDLNNNTVVDLDVPDGLWLEQYQASTVRNGKFYIALSPEATGEGNIYIFDINSTNPKGVVGAAIRTGADQRYIGIY